MSVSQAKRLAVTEGARVATEAQKQFYLANGYDEYEFISEPSACGLCKPLDGKIFKVKDMEPGLNASPVHPFCRCATAAHYSDNEEYERPISELWESRYGKIEEEVTENSHKGIDRSKQINRTAINSDAYRRRIDSLNESPAISKAMWQEMRLMLKHRNGTDFEDLAFINTRTGKVLVSNHENKVRTVSPTKAMMKMLKSSEKNVVVGIHNHPGSSVPSYSDLQAAHERGYKYGLIACHDGTIFKYTVRNSIDEGLYRSFLVKLDKKGYNEDSLREFSRQLSLIGVDLEVI